MVERKPLSREQIAILRAIPVSHEKPNRLQFAMALVCVKQGPIAEWTELTQATVSDICNFKYVDLKHSTVQRLAAFFGCQIEDLFPPLGATVADTGQPALPFARRKAVGA